MSVRLESGHRREGTRVRLYPQAPSAYDDGQAETVWLSPPAGSVGEGPADARMYTVFPVAKNYAYGLRQDEMGMSALSLPPWRGPILEPAAPNAAGHFDDIPLGTPQFEMAHLYGATRFTLDVWEDYFGHAIPWHFAPRFERLELSIIRGVDNAFMGYGFLETGADVDDEGKVHPYALNFDVVAHEVGHAIIYSLVGTPTPEGLEGEYYGFQESSGDMVALLSTLHFDSVVDQLLENTRGNLYTFNRLNRFGETSSNEQIRLASNPVKLSAFSEGWDSEHELSGPLTGALFDSLIDIFHEYLLDWGLISPRVEDFADQVEGKAEFDGLIQAEFDRAFARDPDGFKRALLTARDDLGRLLASTWGRLPADSLNYVDVAELLLEEEEALTGGRFQRLFRRNFLRREIGLVDVGPRLEEADDSNSHSHSVRTVVPEDVAPGGRLGGPLGRTMPGLMPAGRMPYALRRQLAGRGRNAGV